MAAREYELGSTPELTVVVDGEAYGLRCAELGVFTALAEARAAAAAMRDASDEGASVSATEAYVEAANRVARLAFGDEGAARMLGGRCTDAVRLSRLCALVERELASAEASEALSAALRADATADEL